MKYLLSTIFIISSLCLNNCFAQLSEKQSCEVCINILNQEDFPSIKFVAVKCNLSNYSNFEINSEICLSVTENCKAITLVASPNSYLENININEFDFLSDKFCLKASLNFSDSLFFKSYSSEISKLIYNINILGFTKSEIIISYAQEMIDKNNNTIKIADNIEPLNLALQVSPKFPFNFEYVTNSDIRVYPNPLNSELNIDILSDFAGDYTVSLSSLEGNLIFTKLFRKERFESSIRFELGYLSSGFYIVKFNFNNTIYTKKIVKRY